MPRFITSSTRPAETRKRKGQKHACVIDTKRRSGIAIAPDKTMRAAAQIMEQAGVGALAIVEGERVVGVVTDRDLLRRAIAKGLPLNARIDSVMSTPAITVPADADLHDAFAAFRDHPVRRLVVVRGDVVSA